MMASTATSYDCSENDSLEGSLLFREEEEEEEEEDPIAALKRIKQFISDRDIPASSSTKDEYVSSDDESEASAIHKGILSFLEGKENNLATAPKVSVQFVSPRAGPEGVTPSTAARKTPTSTTNRTPLRARGLIACNKNAFSFDEADYTPPPPHSQTTNVNMLPCETPKHCQLSPDIKIASPPKKNDPFRWAYKVWRQHGLMGRGAGETSSMCKAQMINAAAGAVEASFKTPSPRYHFSSAMDISDWETSPMDEEFKIHNSSITKGVDRAKEFARQSTGTFQTVLSSWKKGRSDTSNTKRERENARRRAPDNFQDLLRSWRDSRLEMMDDGQKRAVTYAREASTNLDELMTTWQDKQTAEFEDWALEYARSAEEFQDLLRKWRQAPSENQTGQERALEYAREANGNVDHIMIQWRESHANEFEDWAREQAHSADELQEILQQWRSTKYCVDEVTVPNQGDALEHGTESEQDQAAAERSMSNIDDILIMRQKSEVPSFQDWAEGHARSPAELQDMLRMWREEKSEYAVEQEEFGHEGTGEFSETLVQWQLSQVPEFTDWARNNAKSDAEYQFLLQKWHAGQSSAGEQATAADVGEIANGNFAKVLSKWSTHSSPNMEEWAQEKSVSSQAFQELLRRWREEKPRFATSEQILDETQSRSNDSNMESWIMQKAVSSAESPPDYKTMLSLWEEAKRELSQNRETPRASEHSNAGEQATAADVSEIANGNFAKVLSKWSTHSSPNMEEWAQEKSVSSQAFQELLRRWREEKPQFATDEQTQIQNAVQVEYEDNSNTVSLKELKLYDSNMECWVKQKALLSPASSVDYQAILKTWEEAKLQLSQDNEARNRTSSAKFERILMEWHESDLPRFEDWAKQNTRSPDELQSLLRKWRAAKPTFVARELPAETREADRFFDNLMASWEVAKIESSAGKKRSKAYAHHSTGSFQNLVSSWKDSSPHLDAVEEQYVVDDGSISMRSRASVRFAPDVQLGGRRNKVLNAFSDDCAQAYFESLLDMNREEESRNNEDEQEGESENKIVPGKMGGQQDPHDNLQWNAEGLHDENLPVKTKMQHKEDVPIPGKMEKKEGSNDTPEVKTGAQHAAEFAQDTNGDFDSLMKAWREPKYSTPDGSGCAQECSRHSTGKFQNIISSWKEEPTRLEGVKGDSTELRTPMVGLVDSSFPDESLLVERSQSRNFPSVENTENKSTSGPASSTISKNGNFDGLMKRWKEAKPEVQTGEHRAAEFARDANDNFESTRTHFVETSNNTPGERYSSQGEVTQPTCKECPDKTSSDHAADESSSAEAVAHEATYSTCCKSDDFDGLIKQWKSVKPEVQTGEQRAAEFARDGTGNFDDIRTNFLVTPKGMDQTKEKACPSTGKQRAADFARDASGDFAGIRTNWIETNRETPKGAAPARENAGLSTGKQRAQEFARASNLELEDLLAKFNNKEYSSLEASSSTAETGKARSMPSSTPITALIAALASGHTPLLGASPSVDGSEDFGSFFDDSDIEVAPASIPEGEDPIVAPNGHLRTCACASSLFSGNNKLVEFFLPQLGMACTCGKDVEIVPNPHITDLTAIELILRPWQCEFLKSFGIHRGDQLVKAHHRSAGILAKAMKKWRKKYDLPRARTESCGLALHIWSKTCKFEVRAVRRQIALGVEVIKPPNAVSVLSHLLAPQGERRVSVPHSDWRQRSPEDLVEAKPQTET